MLLCRGGDEGRGKLGCQGCDFGSLGCGSGFYASFLFLCLFPLLSSLSLSLSRQRDGPNSCLFQNFPFLGVVILRDGAKGVRGDGERVHRLQVTALVYTI